MIHPDRIKIINAKPVRKGDFVLYWMQASQREEYNHALEFAARKANEINLPLIVYFGITPFYPGANSRHYRFMIEGLKETQKALAKRKIKMVVRLSEPDKGYIKISKKAALGVVDCGYTRIQKKWRNKAAKASNCRLYLVETDVIVPADVVSGKEEYSAATIRNKIKNKLPLFLKPVIKVPLINSSLGLKEPGVDIADPDKLMKKLKVRLLPGGHVCYKGGTGYAKKRLNAFIKNGIDRYAEMKNDPAKDYLSGLSPYIHFGQISPLYVALRALSAGAKESGSFLEELIIRRELAVNFVNYNMRYDSFKCLNDWCKKTLVDHENDRRDYKYSLKQLENARTHDPYWNSAQKEMVLAGKMHGYMRMYWGKKIIEWTGSVKEAYKRAVYLNDKYELDGRDPNGYAGIAWCFGKHDRAWTERKIFGKIRYMNSAGLERKFNIMGYVKRVNKLSGGKR